MENERIELSAAILQGSPAYPEHSPWCPRMELNHLRRRLQRRALPMSYTGEMERPAGNDPASIRWQRMALPLSYGRLVGGGRNRTSCPQGSRLQRDDGTSLSLLALPISW